MPTGARNIAFVDKGNGKIEPRDVKLAGQFGDFYAVGVGRCRKANASWRARIF